MRFANIVFSRTLPGIFLVVFTFFGHSFAQDSKWVGTWSAAPYLVESHNMPPSPGLANNSLRQIIRTSIGGDTLRVTFSNRASARSTTINSVTIAFLPTLVLISYV